MNLETLSSFFLGATVGASIGIWRTWAFSRKLIHLGVSLDQWSDYCEHTLQAHGHSRPKRDNVAALRRDATDDSGTEPTVTAAWGSAPANRMRP